VTRSRAKSPKSRPPIYGGKPITVQDVRDAGKQARYLLDLVDRSDEDLAKIGLTEITREALEGAARLVDFKMPSCRALMLAGFSGDMDREAVLRNYHRAMGALHGAAPAIVWAAAAKVDDANAPGSTRMIEALLKGIGLLQPAEAVSTKQRLDAIDMAKIRERARTDPASMKAELLLGT
jgi:hypothetical protein